VTRRLSNLQTLLAALRDQASELLCSNEIYEIFSYGWSDQDTFDTDHIGHAMWQTSPPFEPDWTALLNGTPINHKPTKRDEILLLSGEDFAGTMIFARHSLGMALLCATAADTKTLMIDRNQEWFWHQYATTLQWLNIASDRIRDFFLMASFGQTKKQYVDAYKNKN